MTNVPRLTVPLANWIANARPGDRVIVQTAPHNANRDVMDARAAGHITTIQKRAIGHAFHLIAIRTASQPKADKAPLGRGSIGQGLERAAHLHGLQPDTRERIQAVVDCKARGLKRTEIAERLGISEHSVKHYMRRAREEGIA